MVTVDPGVAVDGTAAGRRRQRRAHHRAADRRRRRAGPGVEHLRHRRRRGPRRCSPELVDEFGALDAVVNVAGISRPTGFASGAEDDWRAVLDVHLNGYLNVLRAALPIMAAAGPRPHPRRHVGIGLAARRRRRLQLRQARGRRAHVADRAGDAARA